MSHGAPYYIPKSLIELLSSGFFFSDRNVCTWNDVDIYAKAQEGGKNPKRKGAGTLVGKNTKAALQKMNIIRHILGHLHVNKIFHDFYCSISSGDFSEEVKTKKVGFLTANGDFHYIDDINNIQAGINKILHEA